MKLEVIKSGEQFIIPELQKLKIKNKRFFVELDEVEVSDIPTFQEFIAQNWRSILSKSLSNYHDDNHTWQLEYGQYLMEKSA